MEVNCMSKSRESRVADVRAAHKALRALLTDAVATEAAYGENHAKTLAAWEAVEQQGATIHRQSRLLAGKSRGG